jgi:carboxyl-terminal processing protease
MENKIQEEKNEKIIVMNENEPAKETNIVASDMSHLKNRRLLNQYLKWVTVLFCALAIFWIGYARGERHSQPKNESLNGVVFENMQAGGDSSINFSLFWDVWDLLKEKYVDSGKLEAQKLFYGAIKGMLAATGDPYTTFFDPEETKAFGEDISGSFEGIGAELGVKNEVLTVIAPLEGTPAEQAGLRAGDKIIKIDGKLTSDMSVDEAVDLIRGKKGTEVVLNIFRSGDEETRDVKVTRNVINVKSVKYETKDGNIAFIRVSRFGEDTAADFAAAIKKASSQNAKGIILDLRNNPGGYLDASIDMAGRMLPRGKVVVIEESGDGKQKKMTTRGGDVASAIPMVVLINEGSASASEILAGALKDNRTEITLVGKKSFGKGSVQEFIELPQKTAVKITVARWLTPNGKQINEEGISPDVEVEFSNDDYQNDRDPQLDKALEILKGKIK